jgi:hypothetical protein
MAISLVQRVSPRGVLHVWIAVTPRTAAPPLAWTLDGATANPTPLRAIESARNTDQTPDPGEGRAFVGLYELADPNPQVEHLVRVNAGGESASLRVRAIPSEVPQSADKSLRILLVSCFHVRSDPGGATVGRRAAEFLAPPQRPDLSFFLGDQVYNDLPLFDQPLGNEAAIARKLEQKYMKNWIAPSEMPAGRGYYELLAAAPAVFNIDDHDYWNNYPLWQPQLLNTYTLEQRRTWRRAAERMHDVFQLHHGAGKGEPFVINDIDPLSILIVDTRYARFDEALFHEPGKVTAWADALLSKPDGVGILITGQSIFDHKAGAFDKNMLDFPEGYNALVNAIRRVTAKRPVLCITGDVHFGRVLAPEGFEQSGRLFEVISSPASLVDDPAGNLKAALNPFDDPVWPKHSKAPGKPKDLQFAAFPGQQFKNVGDQGQLGNHIATLSLRRLGAAIHAEVRFKPMHPDRDLPVTVREFMLQ